MERSRQEVHPQKRVFYFISFSTICNTLARSLSILYLIPFPILPLLLTSARGGGLWLPAKTGV